MPAATLRKVVILTLRRAVLTERGVTGWADRPPLEPGRTARDHGAKTSTRYSVTLRLSFVPGRR